MTPSLTETIASTIPVQEGRADCPFCDASTMRKSMKTLVIDEPNNRWSCTHCGVNGDAREFLRLYGADAALRWLDRQEARR